MKIEPKVSEYYKKKKYSKVSRTKRNDQKKNLKLKSD